MPNLGAVMLWQAVSHAAIKLSTGFVQSFRRQPAAVDAERIEASMETGMLEAALSKTPSVQKPEKKIGVKAAA